MGVSISCVPTDECMQLTIKAVKKMNRDLYVQMCRKQILPDIHNLLCSILKILEKADRGLGELLPLLTEEDILVVMADHGNDPDIGHSKHTRECVPLLVYKKGIQGRHLGIRKTLSDVGASVCEYFGVKAPQNGTSFLNKIQ